MNDLPRRSALELAAALRAREISSLELLEACLTEVDRLNGSLNAVVWRDDDAARAAASEADERLAAGDDAPFLGVPMPIKDLTEVHGWPLSYGSRGRTDAPWATLRAPRITLDLAAAAPPSVRSTTSGSSTSSRRSKLPPRAAA